MKLHLEKRIRNNVFRFLAKKPEISSRIIKTIEKGSKRNIQIFCVGLPRSGTHSLANLFGGNFRSIHEPLVGPTVEFCMRSAKKNVTVSEIENMLMMRDIYLNLEVEAAHYLYMLVPNLVTLFPEAKFILSVREPRSWLESEINMNLRTTDGGLWNEYQKFKYGKYSYPYESEYLEKNKYLYPILSYLEYYKNHIETVIDCVPNNKLLIIDTFSISSELHEIASFAGVDKSNLNIEKEHVSKGKRRILLKEVVDENVLHEKINTHCLSFIEMYVPILKNRMGYLE